MRISRCALILQLLDKKKNIKLRTERDIHFWNLTDNGSHFSPLEILDYASGVFSIEMRYPFWDKRMIEFCLSLPPEQKIKKGWTRMIMRRAMEGILPPEIQWRPGKPTNQPVTITGCSNSDVNYNDVIIKNRNNCRIRQHQIATRGARAFSTIRGYFERHSFNSTLRIFSSVAADKNQMFTIKSKRRKNIMGKKCLSNLNLPSMVILKKSL
jgi:hypothetical protein